MDLETFERPDLALRSKKWAPVLAFNSVLCCFLLRNSKQFLLYLFPSRPNWCMSQKIIEVTQAGF